MVAMTNNADRVTDIRSILAKIRSKGTNGFASLVDFSSFTVATLPNRYSTFSLTPRLRE